MRHDFQPENGNTVRRRLRLDSSAEANRLIERLGALEGIKWLELDGTDLKVAYDFTRLDYDTVRRELEEIGCSVKQGGLERLRAAWYRFTDGNARDNTHLKSTCCSPPPKNGPRRR